MVKWRLLRTEYSPASLNMATDQAVMETVSAGGPPTFRVYEWRPSAISIGYFQGMKEEVDVGVCEERNVEVVRRLTGGGAVFHDEKGEVTYSIIFREGSIELPPKILDAYPLICDGLVRGLKKLGVEAAFRPVNDIIVGKKKISGNAQTRRMGCVLQHGTLLYDVDPELMFTLLLVPDEKMRGKMIAAVKEGITSVRHETGGAASITDVEEALIEGFSEALDIELVPGELSPREKERAEELRRTRYGSREWNFKR